jgi:hypothetical protein
MTLPTQVRRRSRPAKANVLGQQKLGCQETERDLNESSEYAPHSIILPVYLDASASFKEAQERNTSSTCELFAGRGSDALYQGTTLVGPYKATNTWGFSPWLFGAHSSFQASISGWILPWRGL